MESTSLSSVSDVVEHNVERWGLLSEVCDHGAAGADRLASNSVCVKLDKAAPFSELLAGVNHDQLHVVLLAQRLDEASVLGFVAVLGQAAKASSSAVEGLGAPAK